MATIQIRCSVPVHLIVNKRQLDSAEAKAFSAYDRRVLLKLASSRTVQDIFQLKWGFFC